MDSAEARAISTLRKSAAADRLRRTGLRSSATWSSALAAMTTERALEWAATRSDEELLLLRNIGPKTLAWIRELTPPARGATNRRVVVDVDDESHGRVVLDGQDISSIAYRTIVEMEAGHPPRVRFDVDAVRVRIDTLEPGDPATVTLHVGDLRGQGPTLLAEVDALREDIIERGLA